MSTKMVELDGIEMTTSQKGALNELRERLSAHVSQKIYDDTYLFHRFLKASNFNVNNAEHMIKKMLQWRNQLKLDTIIEDYDAPEVYKMHFDKTVIAHDKNGTPVHYVPTGKLDSKGILSSVMLKDIEKGFAQITERDEQYLMKNRKIANGPYPGYIWIYDIEGLDFVKSTDKKAIETSIRILTNYQKYYPYRLGTVYIINTSNFFSLPFNIVKSFFDASILNIIRIFGTDGWKEELLKIIDADQLPSFLGGTRTDPDGDPLCKTIVPQAFKVDEKFYLPKSKKALSAHPEAKKLELTRASFMEIEVEIKEAGSLIEWEFETKNRDIGFGLFYKEMRGGEEKIIELVPLLRLDTESYAETGMYQCEKAGTYVILFDNSYSWIRSKEIYYRTKIITPKDHENQMQDKSDG